MFSARMKSRIAGMAMAGALFALPAAAMAGVVVKVSGPSAGEFPVGTQLDDEASITLREGDQITVLTSEGTRVMQGPGTFQVGEGASRTRARFSNLTRRRAARRVRTGAVRGAEAGPARSPNLWFVDVTAPGTVCVYDLAAVRLWRPDTAASQTYTIRDQASRASLEVSFAETESVRALRGEGFALTDGGNYSISGPAAAVEVTFVTLDGEYEGEEQLAQALYQNGCSTQLALLADTLEAAVQ